MELDKRWQIEIEPIIALGRTKKFFKINGVLKLEVISYHFLFIVFNIFKDK